MKEMFVKTKIESVLIIISLFASSPQPIFCWDLSVLKVPSTYYASSVAVYKNRAFLALPRSSCFNNIVDPTLVEVPWWNRSKRSGFRKRTYPHYKEQRWGACKDHQDVISLDVEQDRGKLWVLDRGSAKCPAKIVIYNLYYNTIGQSSKLSSVSGYKLSSLVVDPLKDEFGTRAYIGGNDNEILVYFSRSLNSWKVTLISGSDVDVVIRTNFLAIAATDSLLYMTGNGDFNLHSLNLTSLRPKEEDVNLLLKDSSFEVDVTTIGEKLGPSAGLASDSFGGLYYYLTRDYAIVRWNTSMPLTAEYHDVIIQSYQMFPYVSQIFYGPKSTIWALVNPGKSEFCHRDDKNLQNNSVNDLPRLETRIVKIGQIF